MITEGLRIDGRFVVERKLGEGAAAQVFRCHDENLDRHVAVKLMEPRGPLASPERFAAEARALARLQNRNILGVLGFGFHEAMPFLVLELAEGGSLQDKIRRGGIPSGPARGFAEQVINGLDAAHQEGILHRDLKPENVLLTREGVAKLADFGIAKIHGSGVRTASGIILGTPEYMAPEVMLGEAASPASDIYSFGCLIYALLNGRSPHVGPVTGMLESKRSGRYARGTERGGLEMVIQSALHPEPGERPTAAEIRALLREPDPLPGTPEVSQRQGRVMGSASGISAGGGGRAGGVPWARMVPGALALLVGAAVVVGRGGPPAPAPGPAVPVVDPEAEARARTAARRELLGTWRDRLQGFTSRELLGPLHEKVAGFDEGFGLVVKPYTKTMQDVRDGRPTSAQLGPLEDALGTLPFRAEVARDLDELGAALGDPAIPFRERARAHEALLELGFVDAYYEAWGFMLPYRVGGALARLFETRTHDREGEVATKPGKRLGAAGVRGPGRYLLFDWSQTHDLRYPWLFAGESEPSTFEAIGIQVIQSTTEGRWKLEDHRAIHLFFQVDAETVAADLPLALLVPVSNLVTPYLLNVRVNGARIAYWPELGWPVTWDWRHASGPDLVVEARLPPGAVVAGRNEVVIDVAPLPGLPRWSGVAVYWVGLEAGRGPQ